MSLPAPLPFLLLSPFPRSAVAVDWPLAAELRYSKAITTSCISSSPLHHSLSLHRRQMVGLTSAAGLVGFLSEPDPALQSFALQRLNDDIDLLWPEVAGSLAQM